ncbi:hypothetical protein [Cohnella yongneupensis]|uniref:Uncharacterized protein n=1 Tax=Cohnella yongneupensis TaxID=425006 RepID=A0ABW0QYG2_9BACL
MLVLLIVFGGIILISVFSGIFGSQTGSVKASPEQRDAWRLEAMRRDQESKDAEERRKWMRDHSSGEIGERIVAEHFSSFDPKMQILYPFTCRSTGMPIQRSILSESIQAVSM